MTYRYSINFSKAGDAIFIGNNDLMNIFRRALRRAGLPLNYTEGFNPRPKISFEAALPVGVESMDEWCEIELSEKLDAADVRKSLEGVFPDGVEVKSVSESMDKNYSFVLYSIKDIRPSTLRLAQGSGRTEITERLKEFYASDRVKITKHGKKGPKEIDLKDSVMGLAQNMDNVIEVRIKSGSGVASIIDVAKWIFDDLTKVKIVKERVCRTN